MPKLVLTLIADDRPGLVRSVSDAVLKHGGNWLESRLARMAGKFAGIVSVEVTADRAEALTQALKGLEAKGLRLAIDQGTDEAPVAPAARLRVEVIGADHPGIVHQIADLFASRHINVEELETERRAAAMSGQAMFEARMRVQIPATVDRAALQRDLERLAQDLMVDLTLAPEEPQRVAA